MNINQDNLNQFYKENIYPIIAKKSNYEAIHQCLLCIRGNPSVVDSRYYPQMREECFRLFALSVQIAIEEIFSQKKKTEMNANDYEYYINNKGKLDTIEFDLINQSSMSKLSNERMKLEDHFAHIDQSNDLNQDDNDSTKRKTIEQEQSLNSKFMNNNILPFDSFDLNGKDNDNDNNNNNDMNVDDDNVFNNSSSEQTSINQLNSNCYSLNALYDNTIRSPQAMLFEKNRNTGPQVNHNHNTFSNHKTITRLTQPSIQKETKSKLKKFQFRFTKRENIDKKILRKFRKFLSQRIKKNDDFIQKIVLNNDFWISFINKNLLPPFIYPPENKTFKSFNTRFLLWIFEHDNSSELYSYYIKSNYQVLVEIFSNKFGLKEGNEEFALLKNYINSFAQVFGTNSPNSSSATTKVTYDLVFESKPNKSNVKVNEIPLENGAMMNCEFDQDNRINSIQKKTSDIFDEIITNDYLQGAKSMGYYSYENEDIMMNYFDNGFHLNEYEKDDGLI